MNIDGNWELHYDWNSTGNYGQAPITFNANHTFNSAPYTGEWVEDQGDIIFRFDVNNKTTYSGNWVDGAMVGASSTFAGLNGSWYALRNGPRKALEEHKPTHDMAGKKA